MKKMREDAHAKRSEADQKKLKATEQRLKQKEYAKKQREIVSKKKYDRAEDVQRVEIGKNTNTHKEILTSLGANFDNGIVSLDS